MMCSAAVLCIFVFDFSMGARGYEYCTLHTMVRVDTLKDLYVFCGAGSTS